MSRVVGVVLVRDEDVFVERAVRNVAGFCDELLLFDHRSRDRTPEILRGLAAELPHARFEELRDPAISHERLLPYVGTDTWVFGVDGDELYDPEGLRRFRPRLLAGEYDDWWLVRSNVLHAVELDEERGTARGYTAPPAPSMVKLHNFALIESWDGRHPERLHGTEGLRFKPGREGRKLELEKQVGWDESPLRCLHLCFVRRSTRERKAQARVNIPDLNAPRRLPRRLWYRTRVTLGREQSDWKLRHYRQGELVRVDASPFFR